VKEHIQELLSQSLQHLLRDGTLNLDQEPEAQLERTRSSEHGEFATNLAMTLAKNAGMKPRDLAQAIIDYIPRSRQVEKMEIAGPGFINFFMHHRALTGVINDILRQRGEYGSPLVKSNLNVTLEYVSANPTGPLHVGHGRGAAYGASLSNILKLAGYRVQNEYYVNDNGRQMDILATCVWLRYLELCGQPVSFPENGYRGEYIYDIARTVRVEYGDKWRFGRVAIYEGLPPSLESGGDGEAYLDALIERARKLLGKDGYAVFFNAALDSILKDIQDDLREFGVVFDQWFSEQALEDSGAVGAAI